MDMSEQTPKSMFLTSMNRCLANDAFIPAFYERFMGSSEEIKNKFRFTNFEKQNAMLARSLELCAGATAGEPESLVELNERARTHDRDHLNIEPSYYNEWLEAIVVTASEFDEDWADETEEAWRKILGYAIEHMVRKY